MYKHLVCNFCGEDFVPRNFDWKAKYCSRICYYKGRTIYKTKKQKREILKQHCYKWKEKNPEKVKEYYRFYMRKTKKARTLKRKEKRLIVLNHYGHKCVCCGEAQYEFLVLDHIYGCGDIHRKLVGSGDKFILWVIENNFPKSIQILCHNCNAAKAYHGECPHQRYQDRQGSSN